ncbi:DOMON-like domain-containing protein [Methylomagnum sp.]
MQSPTLTCHYSTPCAVVHHFAVRVNRSLDGELALVYAIEGDIARLRLPPPHPPRRADELWRHTCFEAFLRSLGEAAYHEFNFAPSGDWACYRFDAYRVGMADAPTAATPSTVLRRDTGRLELEARLNLHDVSTGLAESELCLGLSAIIETEDGGISFWALAHPPGRPDFHHAAGFALPLARPDPAPTPPTRK